MKRIYKKVTILLMGVFIALMSVTNMTSLRKEEITEEVSIQKVDNLENDFILGTDASSVIAVEESGGKYYDFDGQEKDVFAIMADAGVNYIRVKVWNDPYDEHGNGYGGGNSDLAKAIAIGKRATAKGMKLLVDFHYSDFWADPGRQNAPKAWEKLSADQKASEIYEYTKESLVALHDAGVDVGMVQVGNETTGQGICGETKLENKLKLFKAGSKAIRDVSKNIKVAVHFTNPEKGNPYTYTKELYDGGVDFDVVATSYYPVWHGTLSQLSTQLNKIVDDFDKEVMVAETAYPYTLEDGDDQANLIKNKSQLKGYDASVDGQANMFRDVVDTVNNGVKNSKGIGVFYWENTWIPVNQGNGTRADNEPLWETYGSGWATKAATTYDKSPTGSGIATMSNYGGTEVDNQAMFDFAGHALPSLRVFTYVFTGYNEKTEPELVNVLKNPGFEEEDMSIFEISKPYVSRKTDDPFSGAYSVHFYSEEEIDFNVSQEVTLPAGTHKFSLHIQGGANVDTSDIYAYVAIGNQVIQKQLIQLDGWCNWKEPTITFSIDEETTLSVGLHVQAEAFSWGTTDDWKLVTKELKHVVDKSQLQAIVAGAIAIDAADAYTASTWNVYLRALEQAKSVLEDEMASQNVVDEACTALLQAIEQLKKVNVETGNADNENSDTGNKTEESTDSKNVDNKNSEVGNQTVKSSSSKSNNTTAHASVATSDTSHTVYWLSLSTLMLLVGLHIRNRKKKSLNQ
ncbi:hypothetical protein A4S06_09950 [Erysipelotrichaceae bacterium MTC7]|nr:hypothetical protein A4S06_09950 [Erysipelotrichaceae bacterium MTC7]